MFWRQNGSYFVFSFVLSTFFFKEVLQQGYNIENSFSLLSLFDSFGSFFENERKKKKSELYLEPSWTSTMELFCENKKLI